MQKNLKDNPKARRESRGLARAGAGLALAMLLVVLWLFHSSCLGTEANKARESLKAKPCPAAEVLKGLRKDGSGSAEALAPEPEAVKEPEDPVIHVAAVGDVMLQRRCNRSARQKSKGDENHHGYDGLFTGFPEALSGADLSIANMEFPVFPEQKPERSLVFHGTTPVIHALNQAGFNVLSAANNHSFDHGRISPVSTRDECDQSQAICIGVGRDREEAEQPYVVEIRGTRLAVIGYTTIFNNHLNSDKPEAPRVNGASHRFGPLVEQVKQAAQSNHGVIVTLHWGEEYRTAPLRWQYKQARELAEAGACLIIGHHPHVLERIEPITTQDGRKALVAYSLGNFLSNQGGRSYASNTRIGAILKADLVRTDKGVEVVSWDTMTTWVYNQNSRIDGNMIEDIHVEVAPLMIKQLEQERDAEVDEAQKKKLQQKIDFYQGRIQAAENILVLPRGPAESDQLAQKDP